MKKVVYLTCVDPVPKMNYGGPGRVIDSLARSINALSPALDWRADYIAKVESVKQQPRGDSGGFRNMLGRILDLLPAAGRSVRSVRWKNSTVSMIEAYRSRLFKNIGLLADSDIFHAHDIFAMLALREIHGAELESKPVCLTIHAAGSTTNETAIRSPDYLKTDYIDFLKALEEKAIAESDCVIMPSRASMQLLKKDFPFTKKEYVLHNSADETSNQRTGSFRKEFAIPASCAVVVTVGRLISEKRFDLLLRAAAKLDQGLKDNLRLVIIGKGGEEASLKSLASSLGLDPTVIFAGFREDVNTILPDCDLYVSSSSFATFDLALIEAMRAGLPLIATDAGGNPEVLGNSGAGILVKKENLEELSAALKKLASDAGARRGMSEKALSYYRNNYTPRVAAQNAVRIYEAMLIK